GCVVKAAVLPVDQTREPGDRPWIRRRLRLRRALERRGRVIEAAFSQRDAREVERALATAELFDYGERGFRLSQLTATALSEQSDAVIVPALPQIDLRFRRGNLRVGARDRKRDAIGRERHYWEGVLGIP